MTALRIRRQADATSLHRVERFDVDVPPGASLWDCLAEIADRLDPSLAFRDSCRIGVCGECGVTVDGATVLGCTVPVADLADDALVEPLRRHRVLRDLVVDRAPVWESLDGRGFVPSTPPVDRVADALMVSAQGVTACTMCGLCVAVCESLDDPRPFAGPLALAWTTRFLDDPRDGDHERRRALLGSEAGVAGCVGCGACDLHCPEHVLPYARMKGRA